jgi:arsenical pump membrane protein
MAASLAHPLLIAIVALSILLMLLRPRDIPEVYWAGSGAVLLVLLRIIPLSLAGRAIRVYLFLTGMMLLSELARENGVFDWLSATAVHHARGSSVRLFTLTYALGTAVTITLSNDATAVVLTPAILAAVRRARAPNPLPYLFACAFIANAASFVLPISNPANLVVFRSNTPPLGHWLAAFLLPSLACIAVTYAVLRVVFRKDLADPITDSTEAQPLAGDGKLVLWGLALVVAVLLGASALHRDLGLPTCLVALAVTAVVCVKRHESPLPLVREISWATLALVAALFVLVRATESVGALRLAQTGVAQVHRLPTPAAALVLSSVVAVSNNLFNNLPLGLLAGAAITASHMHGLLANAVLIAVDLGPNLSVTGSLATILWLIALRKENLQVTAMDFLKVGVVAMPAALLAAIAVTVSTSH